MGRNVLGRSGDETAVQQSLVVMMVMVIGLRCLVVNRGDGRRYYYAVLIRNHALA